MWYIMQGRLLCIENNSNCKQNIRLKDVKSLIQSILKEISPGFSLERLMLKLKLWPHHAKSWLIGKDSDAGRDWGQEEKRMTEDEIAGWHHWLHGREFGWTPGVGDGQGGLACCNSWGCKQSDRTEWLNWTQWYLSVTDANSAGCIHLPFKKVITLQIIFSFTMIGGATGEGKPDFEGSSKDVVYQLYVSP